MSEDSLTILKAIAGNLWAITTPLLVWFSTIGNCLCIFASLRTEMRNMKSHYYFISWTIVNEAYIIFSFIMWILYLMNYDWYFSPSCDIIMYIPSLCRFLSIYFAVALTVERFIAIRYPQHRQSTLSLFGNTKIITAAITFCGLIQSSLFIWVTNSKCGIINEYKSLTIGLSFINLIILDLVPAVLIIVMSIQIIMKTRISIAAGRILTNPTTNGIADVSADQQISNVNAAKQMRFTRMLAIVAVVFVCMDAPAHIIGSLFPLQPDWIDTLLIIYNILNCVSRASFGINFFICWGIDQDFRQAAYDTLHCRPRIDSTFPHTNAYENSLCNAPSLATSSDNATVLQDTTVLEMSSNENTQQCDRTNVQKSENL